MPAGSSSRAGYDAWAPRFSTDRDATATAPGSASASDAPAATPCASAPRNASPAPVVSATAAASKPAGTGTHTVSPARTRQQPRAPRVSTTFFAPLARIAFAAITHSSSVSVFRPVRMAVSVSLGHTTSHKAKSASGSGSVGAGAALKTVRAPACRPRSSARIVVASGTSSCVSTTLAPAMAAPALSTSAGASSPLAPATMMIWFSPAPSTTMCAIPDAAVFV